MYEDQYAFFIYLA